jgi:hypothetical protein
MCDPVTASIGMGTSVAGMGLDAYGQHRALNAMRDVWDAAGQRQRGYDAAINQKTQEILGQINPQSVTGGAQAAAMGDKLMGGNRNVMRAVNAAGGRRTGNAEGRAVQAQATSGMNGRLIDQAQLAAILHGLQSGGQNFDMLGRRLGLDTSIIRNDARSAASLVPLQERAAGMQGQWARQLGQLFKMGGNGLMNAGMSAPMGAPAAGTTLTGASYGNAAMSEAPINGWAASPANGYS